MKRRFSIPVVALLAGCGFLDTEPASTVVPPGTIAPPIKAEGWLQGELGIEQMTNKVVVLDFWASFCRPCRREAPELVRIQEAYGPKGVAFVGLTSDSSNEVEDVEEFLDATGITWPNGYGADETFIAYGVEYIPTTVVVGADGRVYWNSDRPGTLEQALDRALNRAGQAD